MAILVLIFELDADKHLAEQLVLIVQEMGVTGCHNGDPQLLAQHDDAAVQVAQTLLVGDLPFIYKEAVVAKRLDLQIIVEFCDLDQFFVRFRAGYSSVKLSGFTCRTNYKSFAVFYKKALRNAGTLFIISYVCLGNQFIKVFKAALGFCNNYLIYKNIC